MSDGPHKSLPMRRGWKKVAEYATNEAFAGDEVRDAVKSAIEKDWHKDVSKSLVLRIRKLLTETTPFSKNTLRSIEDLRQAVSGCVMNNALLDHLACVVSDGMTGDAALRKAVENTLIDRSARCVRQIEEHYLRKPTAENSQNARQRIEEAIQSTNFNSLVDRIVEPGSRRVPNIQKRDGIDDGVRI